MHHLARRVLKVSATAGITIVAGTYNWIHRTGPRKVRRAAESTTAQQEREAATRRLKSIAHVYDADTPLTLRLLTLEDICVGGGASWSFASHPEDNYTVSCLLSLTAYYTAHDSVADVPDAVLSAGDKLLSAIPFNHSGYPYICRREAAVSVAGHTLSWDASDTLIEEARPMRNVIDPRTYSYLYKPGDTTVAEIRNLYGTVFKLALEPVNYFRIT